MPPYLGVTKATARPPRRLPNRAHNAPRSGLECSILALIRDLEAVISPE